MHIEFNSKSPIYLQIIQDIQLRILRGELKVHQQIPSVRDLAIEYGVNPNTMQRSLMQLEQDGFLKSERTSGRFVCADEALIETARMKQVQEYADTYYNRLQALGLSVEEGIKALREREEKNCE